MNNKRFGCLGVVLVVLLCLSVLLNFILAIGASTATSSLGARSSEGPKFDEVIVKGAKDHSDQKIALIYLRGIITGSEPGSVGVTSVDDLKIQLEQASADDKVKAIVLYVDSPGGEVTASDTVYNAVRRVRDEAKKPVVVYMASVAASGGYYVACGGSWLIANETTFTGSIGVIMQTLNYQGFFGKLGLETMTFKSGKFKDMLSGARPVTEEEKQYVQGLVMQTYGKFVGIVSKERGLPEEGLRNGIADGRVVSGKDALEAKLVNQLGEVDDAFVKAVELGKASGAAIIRYESGFKLNKLFRLIGQSEKTKIELDLTKSVALKLEAGRLYYLPSFYAE